MSLYITNNTKVIFINNEFTHNQCQCESLGDNNYCKFGCGITAFNSILTFTGNTTFLKNRFNNIEVSKVGAGAILAVASSSHFTGTSNFFDNDNLAYDS